MTYNIIIGKKKRVKEPCNYKKSFRGDGLDSTLIEDLGGGGEGGEGGGGGGVEAGGEPIIFYTITYKIGLMKRGSVISFFWKEKV